MNKKYIIFLLISIIIIIFLIVLIRGQILIKISNLDTTNPMTKEEIITLLDTGANYNNYYYSGIEADGSQTEHYIKDKVMSTFVDGKLFEWVDYNTGEIIQFVDGNVTLSNNQQTEKNSQYGYNYDIIVNNEEYNLEYEYLGKTYFNGRNVALIQLSDSSSIIRFSIDTETGLILERTDYTKWLFMILSKTTFNRNVKLDVVTDENVKKPDVSQEEVVDLSQ